VPGAAFALGLGIILLIPLVAIAMARLEEIAAIAFGRGPRRLVISPPLAPEGYAPKVSIHVPACCESPEMLVATLDAVAKLEYPNFECIIVINNTPDPALWQPVEAHCRRSASASSSSASTSFQATKPARFALRSNTPRRTPRSSAASTPTMLCRPIG
jgi:cellulose synthase/poly-beta-1,6-N-acetylglucosamine synthase-like glycosyltransferase